MRTVAIVIAAVVGWTATTALACKYSVRDVGFVDLNTPPYRLLLCVNESVPAAVAENLRHIAGATFLDANIQAQVVNVAQPAEADAALLSQFRFARYPAAVLVSPDGRRAIELPMPVIKAEGGTLSTEEEDELWSVMEAVVISPRRLDALGYVLNAHSVVLVIEGTDVAANRRAHEIAAGAAAAIGAALDRMAKPVDKGPVVLTVAQNQIDQERLLLWALGLDVDGRNDPHAEGIARTEDAHIAVLFGRMRKLGPLLSGPGMTQTQLETNLSYIGEDCECELDRSWMHGVMMPHRWDAAMQEAAYQVLAFDPEDALVKTEISRILARGPASGTGLQPAAPAAGGDALLGYSELVIGPDDASDIDVAELNAATAAAQDPLASAATAGATRLTRESTLATTELPGRAILTPTLIAIALGAMVVVAVVGAVVVLVRAREAA